MKWSLLKSNNIEEPFWPLKLDCNKHTQFIITLSATKLRRAIIEETSVFILAFYVYNTTEKPVVVVPHILSEH